MSKVTDAAAAALGDEQPVQTLTGVTQGLHHQLGQAQAGVVHVTGTGLVLAWAGKAGMLGKPQAERISWAEVTEVREDDADLPGVAGAVARKNASHPLYKVLGKGSAQPVLEIRTRRGDFRLWVKAKERGDLRAASVAVSDALAARR